MITIRNTSTLISAIVCAANALAVSTKLQSSASATYTSISKDDELLLKTGDSEVKEFKKNFRLTEGDNEKKDI